jgi:hypothetical protein
MHPFSISIPTVIVNFDVDIVAINHKLEKCTIDGKYKTENVTMDPS